MQGILYCPYCRRVQYSEEDLEAEMRGEYVVRSPSEESEEEEATPRLVTCHMSHVTCYMSHGLFQPPNQKKSLFTRALTKLKRPPP